MYKNSIIAENKIITTSDSFHSFHSSQFLLFAMPPYRTFTTAKVKKKLPSYFFPNSHGCWKKMVTYNNSKLYTETCNVSICKVVDNFISLLFEKLSPEKKEIILMGNFNINDLICSTDSESSDFVGTINSNSFFFQQ